MKISGFIWNILVEKYFWPTSVFVKLSLHKFLFAFLVFFSINFYRVNLIDTCIQVDVASDFYLLYISYKSKLSKIKKNEQR